MGEYANQAQRNIEAALMPLVSSCSIACGGHAGDAETMRATARLAMRHGVSVGAHPSYSDREGFGRRSPAIDPDKLAHELKSQIANLLSILENDRIPMRHIKPHGALYNDAAKDEALAAIITRAAGAIASGVVIVGPPGSKIEAAAKAAGIGFAAEGFVDRRYQPDGALTPRNEAGAIIDDIAMRADQALTIARGDNLTLVNGTLRLDVETLCIHSDSPGAVETAKAARVALETDGFEVRAFI